MYQQYPPPQPVYYAGPQYSGCLKFFLYALAFLVPMPIGLIIGIVFISRGDPESRGLGNTCLILAVVGFVFQCCVGAIVGAVMGFGPLLALPFLEGSY